MSHQATLPHTHAVDSIGPGIRFMEWLVPVGRLFFAFIFLSAAPMHFSAESIAYAAHHGVPLASVLVPLSGVLAFVGGVSVVLGYHARVGAWMLVAFLVPVTLMMHAFWNEMDPMQVMVQRAMFMKNLSMLGGALLLAFFGPGPLSIDQGVHNKHLAPSP